MTDAATRPQIVSSVPLRQSGQTVPRRLEGDVPGGNGLIAFGLSPVAAMR